MKRILFFLFMLALFSTSARSQIPRVINYQGVLLDSNEQPVAEGEYKITFTIFDEQNNELWSEVHPNVFVVGGLFHVLLGTVTPLGIPFDEPYFLGIQVGSDPELQPRMMLTSAAYAIRAEDADKLLGISVSPTPEPNKLLPLDSNAKVPTNALPAGLPPGLHANTHHPEGGDPLTGYVTKVRPDTISGNQSIPLLSVFNTGTAIKGSSNGPGAAIVAISSTGDAVAGQVESPDKSGIYGHSIEGFGVTGRSTNNIGVQGFGVTGVKGMSSVDHEQGVMGEASGYDGAGVLGLATGMYGIGILGRAQGQATWGVFCQGDLSVQGNMTVTGAKTGFMVDICMNDDVVSLERGDVVVISGVTEPVLGTIPVPLVRRASATNATGLMGIVDRVYQIHSNPMGQLVKQGNAASDLGPNGSLMEGMIIIPSAYLSVVTLGAYQSIKVDASYGAINPGDLLASSPNPGYAMKAQSVNVSGVEFFRPGTIIGRALGALESGQDTIPLFVSLQ